MADSKSSQPPQFEQTTLDAKQYGEASNILDAQNPTSSVAAQSDVGASMDAHAEAVKDQVDDAIAKGPKRADASSGGRVMVAETGDLHDLAARRQS